MAFSFDNLINKIKQQFKPTTYLNVDTGEVIKKRIYKTLDETEKSSYIPTDKFEETTGRLPQTKVEVFEPSKPRISTPKSTQVSGTTKGFTIPKSSTYYDRQERDRERQERKIHKAELKQREREERNTKRKEQKEKNRIEREQREFEKRNKSKWERENQRWKERKEKERIKQEEREAKKRQRAIDKADRERKKKYEKAVEKWEKKHKTYEDVKPPAPPTDITKKLETNMEKPLPIIDSIEALKRELTELERKVYPIYDLSSTRSYLLGIVEEMEAYYEGTSDYANYLKDNEEEIADKLWIIQYESKDQEKIDTAITQLATLLNMGTLSPLQQDDLDYIHNNYGWDDTNG